LGYLRTNLDLKVGVVDGNRGIEDVHREILKEVILNKIYG